MQLDAVDLRIFEAVQRDGRITKVVLVEEVGQSPTPPCWMRLRKLEKAGIVSGLSCLRHRPALGTSHQRLMEVSLENHRRADFDRFERAVMIGTNARQADWQIGANVICQRDDTYTKFPGNKLSFR